MGNHFGTEVEIEYEYDVEPNWNSWQSWGQRNNSWEVEWTGWYKQGGQKHNMHFQNFQCDSNGSIWGHGSDNVGTFNISGKCNWNKSGFTFHKQYYGAHTVIYKGRIQKGFWTGNWEIPGNCGGTFQIRCNCPKW